MSQEEKPDFTEYLRAADERRWRVARSMVHEVRSVLTAMKIATEVLASSLGDDREYRQRHATLIAEQAGRLARLLEDFSEVMHPAALLASPESEVADLNIALAEAEHQLSGLAEQVGVSLDLTPAPTAVLVPGNQSRVSQALRGFSEYLVVTATAGSTIEVKIDLAASESETVSVLFQSRAPTGEAAAPVPVDWSRLALAAARQIVEDHRGEIVTTSGETQAPLMVSFPRLRGIVPAVAPSSLLPEEEEGLHYLPRRAA